jgi:hypothetical protein
LAAFDDGRDGSDTLGTYVLRCARPVSGSHLAEEITRNLLARDANFRRLYDRIVELTGAPPPSSEEIGRRLERRIAELRDADGSQELRRESS